MLLDELLKDKRLEMGFSKIPTGNYGQGLNGLLELLEFDDSNCKENLTRLDLESLDIVLYPGCGDDISPCTILEGSDFEKNNAISFSNNRIYIYIDPDAYGMCRSAFESLNGFRDMSNIPKCPITTLDHCRISIPIPGETNGIEGYFMLLDLNGKSIPIIYLQMLMRDFLKNIIMNFHIKAKWIFLIEMEGKSGEQDLFNSFCNYNAVFPEWICISRECRPKVTPYYPNLLPMLDTNGEPIYHTDELAKYGQYDENWKIKQSRLFMGGKEELPFS